MLCTKCSNNVHGTHSSSNARSIDLSALFTNDIATNISVYSVT